MKKVDPYINDLLYDHDCVIITDLGGFIASYKPFSMNTSMNVATPASKKIAFNAALKQNDGLLANHISEKEAMNYVDACELIKEYVSETQTSLSKGEKINIEKVGMLFLNKDKKVEFAPDQSSNFLTSSFGLTPVHSPVIKKENPAPQNTTDEPQTIAIDSNVQGNVHPTKKRKWKLIEVIPAAAVLAILIIAPPVLNNFNTNLGTLLPFSRINEFYNEKIKGEVEPNRTINIDIPSPFNVQPSVKENTNYNTTTNTEGLKAPSTHTIKDNTVLAENENTNTINTNTDTHESNLTAEASLLNTANHQKSYHIIGGCFRIKSNAEKLVKQLEEQGAEATIIGQTNGGLYMVSMFNSGSVSLIHDTIPEFRSRYIAGAWVTRK
jgi:CCDC81-like prokaryotic HU domain 2/CCDC81-like prokaryotic HU domain 1